MVTEALMASWGYSGLVARELARDRLLQTGIPLDDDQKKSAISAYLSSLGIKSDESLNRWLVAEGLDDQQLALRADRYMRWYLLCEKRFRQQVSSLFLKRKSLLDRVVYSLHWVDDHPLAQELFIRLKEGECNFENLSCLLPESPQAGLPSGKFGPIALADVPSELAELLRVSQPGQVWPPKKVQEGWVIIQLVELQPAVFNQGLRRDLCLELGDCWLQECIQFNNAKAIV